MIKDFIKNIIVNLFILESSIVNIEHLERWVYEYGNVVVFYNYNLNDWVVEPLITERQNLYGITTHITTISLKNVEYDDTRHFKYLQDTDKMPIITINKIAMDIDYLIKKQYQQHKLLNLPLLFKGDNTTANSLSAFVANTDLKVITNDELLAQGLQQIPYTLPAFDFTKTISDNFTLIKNLLGFDFYDGLKKERMIEKETEQVADWSNSVFAVYLNARAKFALKMQSMGISFQVSVNE